MKHFHFRKQALCLLLVLLLAAAALTSCTQKPASPTETPKTDAPKTEAQTQAAPGTTAAPADTGKPEELGEGAVVFYLDVTDRDNVTSSYAVHTDADNLFRRNIRAVHQPAMAFETPSHQSSGFCSAQPVCG